MAKFVLLLAGWFVSLPCLADEVRVGWDDYPPYQISDKGTQRGIDVDIISAVLEAQGHRVRFLKLPWARQLKMLESGELDIVMSASKSPERERFARWSEAYRSERAALIGLAGKVMTVPSLASVIETPGTRIAVIRDSSYPGEFERLLKDEDFKARLDFTATARNSLLMLGAGRVTYVIDDPVTAQYLTREVKGPPVAMALEIMSDESFFMLSQRTLARRPNLLGDLNQALARLKRDGHIKTIFRRYDINY